MGVMTKAITRWYATELEKEIAYVGRKERRKLKRLKKEMDNYMDVHGKLDGATIPIVWHLVKNKLAMSLGTLFYLIAEEAETGNSIGVDEK